MLQHDYEESYYMQRESWPDFRAEMEAILWLSRPSSRNRVLEVGCGGGALLRRLGRRDLQVVGVDISTAGLRLASRERGLKLLCANAEALPFAGGSFDAVVSQHLLEHLRDPISTLREWKRLLRAEGTVVLVTPNGAHPDPSIFDDPGHTSLFTPESLRSTLEVAGLRVDCLFTLFPYLGRGPLARSASIRLAPLSRLPGLAGTGRSLVAAASVVADGCSHPNRSGFLKPPPNDYGRGMCR